MKQILILTAILIATTCKGQTPAYTLGTDNPNIIPSNCYFKDNNNILNKFVGTWALDQNGNVFTITLNKALMEPISDFYSDEIQGKYKYVINGNTVVNTESYTGNNSKIKTTFLNFGTEKIALFFYDPERPKIGSRVFLTYSNVGGVQKLHWELTIMGYQPILPGEPTPQLDFRVPTNCELIKQ
jgi:hypothetical protein